MTLAQHRLKCQIADLQRNIDVMRIQEKESVRDSDGSLARELWPKRLKLEGRLNKAKAQLASETT
jgi:hypothetical protein